MQARPTRSLLSSVEAMARLRVYDDARGGGLLLRRVDGVEGGRTETRSHCEPSSPAPALRHSEGLKLAACKTLANKQASFGGRAAAYSSQYWCKSR
jgi:hypothetical protein